MKMSKTYIFPTFHFKPLKLGEEVQRLQNKYKQREQVPANIITNKLPDILAQIRKLKNEKEDIIKFDRKLKSIDDNILSSEYPYEQEDDITTSKIIIILIEKYTSIVGRRFWSHFQHSPFDKSIIQMLLHVFKHESENFNAFKPHIRENYNLIFKTSNSEKVLEQLSRTIGYSKKKIEASFKEWKIEEDSKLSKELWLRILNTYLKEQWFIKLQSVQIIREKLKKLDLGRYKDIITTYLEFNEYQNYNDELLMQVIDRLKDPRENLYRWIGIPKSVIEKVKKYLLEKNLFLFFREDNDSERFAYWQRYIRYMGDIVIEQDPPIAAMYFPDFVVVEFANKGNAAYFYEKEGFSKYLAHKIKRNIKESELKDPHAEYFIHKLNHAGHWPSRYDQYMVNFLRGNLYYRHY